MTHQDRYVLLIGGVSSTGKSTAAAEIGRRFGIPWLMVDDLRLAMQRSRVMLPHGTDALYFFADIEERRQVWQEPPEVLSDALIAVGEAISPAIEAVIENHLDQRVPLIIEGDGILPALLQRRAIARRADFEAIRAVFVIERDEEALLRNMLARARGISSMSDANLRAEAHAKWLFGRWLAEEAEHCRFPVIDSRPWANLVERILQATTDVAN